jgi:hypothetical protein
MNEVRSIARRHGKTIHDVIVEGLELWLRENRAPRLPEPPRSLPRLEGPSRTA